MNDETVRLDKWLWAARFFKTRSLAKRAIEAGHVRSEGQRLKPAYAVSQGELLSIRRGDDVMDVDIQALSIRRQSATIAQQLYAETADSITRRAMRQQQNDHSQRSGRPDKKQRRKLAELKRQKGDL